MALLQVISIWPKDVQPVNGHLVYPAGQQAPGSFGRMACDGQPGGVQADISNKPFCTPQQNWK